MPEKRLLAIYDALLRHYGPQGWWPGETPFEVMVGAVLTQNTNWENVRRAIENLKTADLLSVNALASTHTSELAGFIRSSGYYNLKAHRLHNLLALITQKHGGSLDKLFNLELHELRTALLSVKGVGPETADSIILYAAGKPIFVVDAYTHRLLSRHGLVSEDATYQEMQELFMETLPCDSALFNEYHALIVRVGKECCKKSTPLCAQCPLGSFLQQ